LRGRARGITSTDIARKAGVSQATVSRVLNGYEHVSDELRGRVLDVIERDGYAPNAIARGLVTRRTQLVGVIVADIVNPFYPELVEALAANLADRGLKMLFQNAGRGEEEEYVRVLLEHRVEGIIFTSALQSSSAVRRLVEQRLPVVLTNREVAGAACDTVVSDNVGGARAAASHLLELGHKRIALVRGYGGASTSDERERAFTERLGESGLVLPSEYRREGRFEHERAYGEVLRLLSLENPPTAIFCVNDLMAFAALNAARAAGLGVPRDLSVVGFDSIGMAGWESLSLTSVRQPIADIARSAVDLLNRRINDPERPIERRVFPSELMVRGTTSAPSRRPGSPESLGGAGGR